MVSCGRRVSDPPLPLDVQLGTSFDLCGHAKDHQRIVRLYCRSTKLNHHTFVHLFIVLAFYGALCT